jgi:NAD(P)-dependent dehydrogenase (short-subunit alcohol dehydrogenase family)
LIYNSSMFAVEGYSRSIAEGVAPFGVYVMSVSPGFFRTDFLDPRSVRYAEGAISDYAKGAADFRAFHDNRNHTQAGDPAKLAAVILQLAEVEKPPVSLKWVQGLLLFPAAAISAQDGACQSRTTPL